MKEIIISLGIGLGIFFVLLIVFLIIAELNRIKRNLNEKYALLQIRVVKQTDDDVGIGPIAMENIFATLHGISSKFTLWDRLNGYSSDNVSFEIASIDRVIKFYAAFPEKLRNLVEGQIYAQYPDVEIEDCPDYSVNVRNAENAMGMELKFDEPDIYPIKRYSQFEDKLARIAVDPIAGITSALVKFDDVEDQAWIQLVLTPLRDKWRLVFIKCVKIMHHGVFANIDSLKKIYARAFITRKVWPKVVFFPVYFMFWLRGFFITAHINFSPEEGGGADDVEELSSKTHDRETNIDAAIDKVGRPLFDSTVRIVYVPKTKSHKKGEVKLHEIVSSFKQFNYPTLNGFEEGTLQTGKMLIEKYNKRLINDGCVMNNEELATIFHMPNITVKTPTIYWVRSKKLEPPGDLPVETADATDPITILGRTNFRGANQVFGIKPSDRRRHVYVIGKTGMGKSTLLENMIYSDVIAGKGVGVIDPHGDLADAVLNFIPANRINDVVLIDPSDKDYAVAFNMLENVDPALNSIVCSGLVGIFKKIYAESWGPRLEHILRNTILSLLEYPGTTMLGITRILQDDEYRKKIVKKIEDPVVKAFWVTEFAKMQEKFRTEAIAPIQNKVGQFLSSPTIRNIVGQPKSTVDLRFAMDKGKIVIINLSKGKIGEDNSALLGAMFITKFQLDAMSRANIPEKERRDFYLYVDEFQNFATDSFATILSEARKYKLNLTMANQYIAQMEEEVRDAVFGNVGTVLSFQVGFDDAEYISQQYGEEIMPPDLVSLSKYTAYMRLLVDGMPTNTFSLNTLPPPQVIVDRERIDKIVKVSRERYSQKTSIVTDKIKRWSTVDDEKDEEKADNQETKVAEPKHVVKKKA
ncbi:MAG: DUF87 domain-containing protein [Candidatus Peregrinibacteria bacterium]|nr:DUF87 domain-containing protein [Candidatus Peregrinibacteria bacterium]